MYRRKNLSLYSVKKKKEALAAVLLLLMMAMRPGAAYAASDAASGVYTSQSLGSVLYFNTSTGDSFNTPQETYASQAVQEAQEAQKAKQLAEQQAAAQAASRTTQVNGRTASYLGRFKLTGYCPCSQCSEGFGTRTATGTRAVAGRTVAVDPRVIPYGTHLLINGHEYIAEDRGGAVRGNHIDVYYNTHAEARNVLAYADVYILQ